MALQLSGAGDARPSAGVHAEGPALIVSFLIVCFSPVHYSRRPSPATKQGRGPGKLGELSP
jgi:hypothetical protein